MKKRRKEQIEQKIKRKNYDGEVIVYRKLSSYINYSTLYNKVANKHEFLKATTRVYEENGFLVSTGSLIVSSLTGSSLGSTYMNYMENILRVFTEQFPDSSNFDEWVEYGLKALRRKYFT